MYSYFTSDTKIRDEIIELFKKNKVDFSISTQFTFLCYIDYEKTENIILKDADVIYLFQWVDRKIKKIDLIAIGLEA